jgi:hypothetical protein
MLSECGNMKKEVRVFLAKSVKAYYYEKEVSCCAG